MYILYMSTCLLHLRDFMQNEIPIIESSIVQKMFPLLVVWTRLIMQREFWGLRWAHLKAAPPSAIDVTSPNGLALLQSHFDQTSVWIRGECIGFNVLHKSESAWIQVQLNIWPGSKCNGQILACPQRPVSWNHPLILLPFLLILSF